MKYQIVIADSIELMGHSPNAIVITTNITVQTCLPDEIFPVIEALIEVQDRAVGIWNPYTNRFEYWKNVEEE